MRWTLLLVAATSACAAEPGEDLVFEFPEAGDARTADGWVGRRTLPLTRIDRARAEAIFCAVRVEMRGAQYVPGAQVPVRDGEITIYATECVSGWRGPGRVVLTGAR